MKKSKKSLKLNRETLHQLDQQQAQQAVGGATMNSSCCPDQTQDTYTCISLCIWCTR